MNAQLLGDLKKEADHTIASLNKEFRKVRTDRASVDLIEDVLVDCYGAPTPLNQVAALSVPEPRLLVAQPYDQNIIGDIEKAIYKADLGLTPVNDGKVIRVPLPELTEERRKELVRHIRKIAEDYRVSMRNHRRSINDRVKKMQKNKELSEDEARAAQERVQKMIDESIDKIAHILQVKEEDLLSV